MSRQSISRRKQLGIEGLEIRTMMAVDMPRIVPPAIANHIAQLIAPPRRGGGNTDGGPVVDSGERAILRGLATAAAEITAIDAALHPLLGRAGDPLPEGAAAQLERIGAAANHIDSTISPLLVNTDPPTDPAGPNAAGAPAANVPGGPNNVGPNHPGPINPVPQPPTGTHLVRALTLFADRMERLDARITDLLSDADAASLTDRVKLLLGQIDRRAEHIAADVSGDNDPPTPTPVPTPVERHLMGIVAQLRVGKVALDNAVERLGEPGGDVPPLIARFLNSINNHATSVVGQIDEALPDDEGDPAAAGAPANMANQPRHRHPLPGFVVANAAITGADHQVRRILASLGPDGLTARVQELLTTISDSAQAMADAVAPYLPSDEGV